MPYPEYTQLQNWVEHKNRSYTSNHSIDFYWYSVVDIPWQFYAFREILTGHTYDLKDNYLSPRYISVVYSKQRDDLPLIKVDNHDRFSIVFEAVVKSQKKLDEYAKLVDLIVGLPIEHELKYSYNKDCIGQEIIWIAPASEVLKYLKETIIGPYIKDNIIFTDYTFNDYCDFYNIDMDKIDYII